MVEKFEKLLSPGMIGKVRTSNRIVTPPMNRNYATNDGIATRRLIETFVAAAKGGVGLIIVDATLVHPSGRSFYQQLGIYHDRHIAGLNELALAVKDWGSRIAIQLHHAGRQASPHITGMPTVAPSAVPCPIKGGLPKELTTEEIGELVESFAQAARRAKEAGFDAVEIHAAHGYLVNQFLSPLTNRRTDKYGGSLKGRMTFLLEIIKRTKEIVGDDFPIIVRMNAEDLVDGGLEINGAKQIAQRLETAGVNALHVTAGIYESLLDPYITSPFGAASAYFPRGQLIGLAEQIKSVTRLPVIAVGSLTPELGEEILQQGKADFIAMGRNLLADPELPNKLAAGHPEDIRPCIRCNEMCIGRGFFQLGVRCAVNAEFSFERYAAKPTQKRKKVLVVGGGPAGMEVARVSALRGHSVILYEKSERLGGHLNEATVPSFKEDLRKYKDWLIRQVNELGVRIELGKEVTPEVVKSVKPDALILSTGSIFCHPNIPGIDNPIVTTAIDILNSKTKVGNMNIIAGGGAIGCEVALYLAQQGKKVTILEMLSEVATDMPYFGREAFVAALTANGVKIVTDAKIVEICDSSIIAVSRGQSIIKMPCDKVILATGLVSQNGLYEKVKEIVPEVYMIGDCVEPRRVGEATRDGYRVGSLL